MKKYHLGFTFAATEGEARRMVEQFNSEATPYMRKRHPAHFTPWQSSSQTDPAHFVVWHYV
jgi:hypothetical protein